MLPLTLLLIKLNWFRRAQMLQSYRYLSQQRHVIKRRASAGPRHYQGRAYSSILMLHN